MQNSDAMIRKFFSKSTEKVLFICRGIIPSLTIEEEVGLWFLSKENRKKFYRVFSFCVISTLLVGYNFENAQIVLFIGFGLLLKYYFKK